MPLMPQWLRIAATVITAIAAMYALFIPTPWGIGRYSFYSCMACFQCLTAWLAAALPCCTGPGCVGHADVIWVSEATSPATFAVVYTAITDNAITANTRVPAYNHSHILPPFWRIGWNSLYPQV